MPTTLTRPMTPVADSPNDKRVTISLTDDMVRCIEAYIEDQHRLVPGSRKISQSEAIRRLIFSGLIREKYVREDDADHDLT